MPGEVVESNVSAFWVAAQPAKGVPAEDAQKRLVVVGGDLDTTPTHGSENFSELDRWGDAVDFVDGINGGGTLTVQAQADEAAFILWAFFGTESFTARVADTSPPKYVFEPGANIGKWLTFWKRLGLSTVIRRKFNDNRIGSVRIEGSTANKVVKIVPTVLSLDPGEVFDTDPDVEIDATDPFIYTEGEGSFTLDGEVFRGQSQFAVVIDDGLATVPGDSARPYALVPGVAGITLEAITMVLDDQSLAHYNTIVYGDPDPAAGTKPLETIPALGSYSFDLVRGTGEDRLRFKLEIGAVKWNPDVAMPPNPDGGAIELAFGGAMRKNKDGGAAPLAPTKIRITIETGAGDNAAHAA